MQLSKITRGVGFVRSGLITVGAIGLAGTVGLTNPRDLAAHSDRHRRLCSNATVRGDYGFLASGLKPVPPPLGGGTERFTASGVWDFDGDGSFTFEAGTALHGEITGTNPDPEGIVGTYDVNPNCSGTMSWQAPGVPFPIQYTIVIVASARQIKAATTSGQSTLELTRK